jgi:hypothetical protein
VCLRGIRGSHARISPAAHASFPAPPQGYRDGGRPRRSVPRDTLRALLDGARPRDASTLRSILLEGVSLQLDAGALKALVQECAQVGGGGKGKGVHSRA